MKIKQATKTGTIEICNGGLADLSYPESKTRRGRVQGGGMISPTITTTSEVCRIEESMVAETRIRRLTEKETLRLMDVSDEDIEKMAEVNSPTQMYKQAGNSIVVGVMCAMFRQLNITGVEKWE